MSLSACIQRAIDANLISPNRAREAQQLHRDRLGVHAHLGSGADAAAAQDVWIHLRKQHQLRRRATVLQIGKANEIIDQITRYRDPKGKPNAARGLIELLEWQHGAQFQSVSSVRSALETRYRGMIRDFLLEHKRNIVGNTRGKARQRDIALAMHGDNITDPGARAVANSLMDALEQARLDFNAAGGAIGKLEDFGLPHAWKRELVEDAGFDKWSAGISTRLDWDRIIDHRSSQPFSKSSIEAKAQFLREVYDTIVTNGQNKREPSGMSAGRSTANSRSDARVLHFKSGADWNAMNDAFGRHDVFTTIVTHLDGMARDTAMMRVLGPNPRAGLELARQTAAKLAVERPWKLGPVARRQFSSASAEVHGKFKLAERMLDLVNGAATTPEMDVVASALAGTRHFLIASQLAGAMLSAVTDQGFMAMASRHVGMDPGKIISRHIKLMASAENRALAARANVIADSVANTGVAQSRLLGDAYGPEMAERLSEFTMRASGLTAWTDMARGAFRLEFYGFLAEHAGKAWNDLPPPLRELVFEQRGITKADWDIIRSTNLHRDTNAPDATFLIPDDIRGRTDIDASVADDLSIRLEAVIHEQIEFAVPSASLRGRAVFQGGAPGSFAGELLKSGLMYKSFALSLMYNQLGRVAFARVNGSRAANIAMFATITTAAGAVSLQLKDIARGRDPRPMTDLRFWKAAMIQGGGAGIFGDFLYSTENRFGGGLASTFAGPGVGFVNDTAFLTRDVGAALFSGNEKDWTKFNRSAVKYLNRYSGPTNLWQFNIALDRMVWDNLQEAVDPEAAKTFRRAETRRKNEFGQQPWWLQGQNAPDRAPDLSNIFAGAN